MEQETGYRKNIGFEMIRKIDRSTQHNWHKLLREAFPLDHQEAESKEANGVSEAEKENEVKESEKGEKYKNEVKVSKLKRRCGVS